MILQVLEWLLGSTGRALLNFIKANPLLFNTLAVIFLAALGLGHLQLWKIKKKSEEMLKNESLKILSENPDASADDIYQKILPGWRRSIRSWASFIPHRLEFFPVPVTEKNVLEKFDFNESWVREKLTEYKIAIRMDME